MDKQDQLLLVQKLNSGSGKCERQNENKENGDIRLMNICGLLHFLLNIIIGLNA